MKVSRFFRTLLPAVITAITAIIPVSIFSETLELTMTMDGVGSGVNVQDSIIGYQPYNSSDRIQLNFNNNGYYAAGGYLHFKVRYMTPTGRWGFLAEENQAIKGKYYKDLFYYSLLDGSLEYEESLVRRNRAQGREAAYLYVIPYTLGIGAGIRHISDKIEYQRNRNFSSDSSFFFLTMLSGSSWPGSLGFASMIRTSRAVLPEIALQYNLQLTPRIEWRNDVTVYDGSGTWKQTEYNVSISAGKWRYFNSSGNLYDTRGGLLQSEVFMKLGSVFAVSLGVSYNHHLDKYDYGKYFYNLSSLDILQMATSPNLTTTDIINSITWYETANAMGKIKRNASFHETRIYFAMTFHFGKMEQFRYADKPQLIDDLQ